MLITLEPSIFFQMAGESKTRGHRFKLLKQRSRLLMRQHFFSQRVVDEWTGLPNEVVEAITVAGLKKKLDEFFNSIGRM